MQVNVAGIRRNIKNLAHNYSDAQIKVREATSNDPWGPSATIMAEIADLTYNVVAFSEIMQMIWKRLNDHGKNWRHVYKALILLDYLIKTGTEKVAQQCKENIFAIQTLREFIYFEEGKDQGNNVRDKAKQLVILLKDDERLKNERTKALKAKERFAQNASGFGSDGYIEGPTHRETPTSWQDTEPKTAAEIEFVRPQTAGEEELQLQLAMAMSREEAEQEEAKRRSDDVRLQLALSQSEQDFNTTSPKSSRRLDDQSKQSHLMDLLDISLGATNISNPPPLGAGAAGGSDPWGTPARAASQLSDPWSGTTSPQLDAWQPALNNKQLPGAIGVTPDTWLAQRTQSPPSVTSGSSNEGWLQNNAINGNSTNLEPWLNENNPNPIGFIVPQQQSSAVVDPWLGKVSQDKPDDPWLPKSQRADPWAPAPNEKRPSPLGALTSPISDLDDFDVITNRNKTGSLDYSTGSNNNNSSFLDEMDPLSTKKPLKTPQSFLGENSALVNLDNLIKPIISNNIAPAPYNPFSDSSSIPPKTNLFQQQTPAVPSINQLKQQQPFAVSINQDPWAPNNTVNATAQYQYLIDYDSDQITVCTTNNNLCNERTNNNNNNNNINNILCNNDNNKNQLYYLNGTNNYNNNNNSINSFYGYQKNPNDTNNVFGNYFINGNSNNNDPWYNSNNYFSSYNINSNYCKNNNNNMPWLKSEPASSNPFLS